MVLPALRSDWQWNPKLQLPPLQGSGILNFNYLHCRYAHSFQTLKGPGFFSSCCSTFSSMHLTLWKFQCIALERWNPRYLAKVIYLFRLQALFLLLCQFHMNLSMQNYNLPDHQLVSVGKRFHEKGSINPAVGPILPTAIISLCRGCTLPCWFQFPDYFSKPPSRYSVCDSGRANRSVPFVFESSLRPSYSHPRSRPPAPSPAGSP